MHDEARHRFRRRDDVRLLIGRNWVSAAVEHRSAVRVELSEADRIELHQLASEVLIRRIRGAIAVIIIVVEPVQHRRLFRNVAHQFREVTERVGPDRFDVVIHRAGTVYCLLAHREVFEPVQRQLLEQLSLRCDLLFDQPSFGDLSVLVIRKIRTISGEGRHRVDEVGERRIADGRVGDLIRDPRRNATVSIPIRDLCR